MTSFLQAMFTGFTEEEIDAQTEELLERSAAVKENGWGSETTLSWVRGEIVAVALVLGDDAAIARQGQTTEEAISQMAHLLYGAVGGNEDKATGFQRTREYFAGVADKLTEGTDTAETTVNPPQPGSDTAGEIS